MYKNVIGVVERSEKKAAVQEKDKKKRTKVKKKKRIKTMPGDLLSPRCYR